MDGLLAFLYLLAFVLILIPFGIWIFIKFASHHGEQFEYKWRIIGIAGAICFVFFAIDATAIVLIGLSSLDEETAKYSLLFLVKLFY